MNLVYAGFEDFLIGFKGEQGVAELCTNPDANHLVLTTESVKFSPFSGELHLECVIICNNFLLSH